MFLICVESRFDEPFKFFQYLLQLVIVRNYVFLYFFLILSLFDSLTYTDLMSFILIDIVILSL